MTKSKNKSIIALVVMAFMLVASIALAATGAWFTANVADKTATVKFGTITMEASDGVFAVTGGTINDTAKYTTNTDVMPGDTITFTSTVTNSGEKAYLFAKYAVTGTNAASTAAAKLGGQELVALTGENSNVYYVVVDAGSTAGFEYKVVLAGSEYGNDYQGDDITCTISFAEVQYANFADAAAAYAAVEWNNG